MRISANKTVFVRAGQHVMFKPVTSANLKRGDTTLATYDEPKAYGEYLVQGTYTFTDDVDLWPDNPSALEVA